MRTYSTAIAEGATNGDEGAENKNRSYGRISGFSVRVEGTSSFMITWIRQLWIKKQRSCGGGDR